MIEEVILAPIMPAISAIQSTSPFELSFNFRKAVSPRLTHAYATAVLKVGDFWEILTICVSNRLQNPRIFIIRLNFKLEVFLFTFQKIP